MLDPAGASGQGAVSSGHGQEAGLQQKRDKFGQIQMDHIGATDLQQQHSW